MDATSRTLARAQGVMISETADCVWDLLNAIESQRSIHSGLEAFLARGHRGALATAVMARLFSHRQSARFTGSEEMQGAEDEIALTSIQRALLRTIQLGLTGHPIRKGLLHLRDEVMAEIDLQLEQHCGRLPFLSLLPLLFLQLPAFLLITLVPFVRRLSQSLATSGGAL